MSGEDKFKLAYGGRSRGMMLAGLAALAATQSIGMTIPRRYGKTEMAKELGFLDGNRKQVREMRRIQRANKTHKLKGLRP